MSVPDQPSPPTRTAVIWLDPEGAGLLRAVAREAGLRVVGVGSPALGRAGELAGMFGEDGHPAVPVTDLRQVLAGSEVGADVFLLAAVAERADAFEPSILAEPRSRGSVVLTFEPLLGTLLELEPPAAGGGGEAAAPEGPGIMLGPEGPDVRSTTDAGGLLGWTEWAQFVPAFRLGGPMRAAADVLAHMGIVHTVGVRMLSGPGEGSLGARLFDALDVVGALLGEPDTVDAAYVWPGRGSGGGVHLAPGDSLRGLRGAMTANLRYSDGRAAAIIAADSTVGGAGWSRSVTVIAEGGRLTVGDGGFEFIGADGGREDRSSPARPGTAAAAIAEHISRATDPHAAGSPLPPTDYRRVLSAAGAALLSVRTGEAESPGTILRMARTG